MSVGAGGRGEGGGCAEECLALRRTSVALSIRRTHAQVMAGTQVWIGATGRPASPHGTAIPGLGACCRMPVGQTHEGQWKLAPSAPDSSVWDSRRRGRERVGNGIRGTGN